jgi:hypothetical protein
VSPKNVSDTVEAMLGAVWCSGGVDSALHVAINMLVKVAGLADDVKFQKLAAAPDNADSGDFVRELCRDVVAKAAAATTERVVPSATFDSIVAMARSHLSFSLHLTPTSAKSPPPSPPRTASSASRFPPKSQPASLTAHVDPSPSDADRLLHMCTIDESCATPPANNLPAAASADHEQYVAWSPSLFL